MKGQSKRARERLNALRRGEKTSAFNDYHWGWRIDPKGPKGKVHRTGIERNAPKKHMSKKERLRRRWEGRLRFKEER